jgi:hypothetical protein
MFEHGYALLIGVDENKLPNLALPIVKKDVTKLQEVITHPERCGYADENVRALTGSDATREKILDGLDWLKARLDGDASANQTAFIYYSGHGHRETSGESFLVPFDARFPIRRNGLPAKEFAEMIEEIRPRRLLVVLDCCHAGGLNVKDVSEAGVSSSAVTPDMPDVGMLAAGDGRAVLSSSRGTQKSYIRTDGQMSVFTYHLVEALTGHTGRPDWPDVTVTEVMEYVGRTVPATARSQHEADQEPMFQFSGTSFPIAVVLGGKGLAKGLQAPDPLVELPVRIRSTLTVGDVKGEVTNVEVEEMGGGAIDATTTAGNVGEGGKVGGVRIGKLKI